MPASGAYWLVFRVCVLALSLESGGNRSLTDAAVYFASHVNQNDNGRSDIHRIPSGRIGSHRAVILSGRTHKSALDAPYYLQERNMNGIAHREFAVRRDGSADAHSWVDNETGSEGLGFALDIPLETAGYGSQKSGTRSQNGPCIGVEQTTDFFC
jgi:hypothetical protein